MKWLTNLISNKKMQMLSQSTEFEQAEQELKILNHDLRTAEQFFRKNRQVHFAGKRKLPLYIVIGPSHFGKTTLLSQSGLKLIDTNGDIIQTVLPTKYCSWWFSSDAIYLDTAGIYAKSETNKLRDNLVWRSFLKLLKKYRGNQPINGMMVALDLPRIAHDKELLQSTLFNIRERIYEVAKHLKNLPLYIIFTKSDLIQGFVETFSSLSTEESSVPFGITFSKQNGSTDPARFFNQDYDQLLRQLNLQLIQRLHQERDQNKRNLIINFPLQLESLRSIIAEVINKIPTSVYTCLNGIYFTSSIQKNQPIDYVAVSSSNLNSYQIPTSDRFENRKNRPYFIDNLFKNIVSLAPKNHLFIKNNSFNQTKTIALVFTILLIGVSSLLFYRSYQKNVTAINTVNLALQNNQSIISLKNTMQQLEPTESSPWLKYGVNRIKKVNFAINDQIIKTFLPQIQQQLENELMIQNSGQSPQQLYDALKTYLMLGNLIPYDAKFISNWFGNYWKKIYPHSPATQEQLQKLLDWALESQPKLSINSSLVASARATLINNSTSIQRIYLLLENKYRGEYLVFNPPNPSTIISYPKIRVLKMYTATNFAKIYQQQIPEIIRSAEYRDEVIGKKILLRAATDNTNELLIKTKALYLENYLNAWQQACTNITINQLTDLKQATTQLALIARDDSPLLQFLQLLQANLSFPSAPEEFNQLISSKWPLSINNQPKILQTILTNLTVHFSNINGDMNSNQVAFFELSNHMQDNLRQDPISRLQQFSSEQPEPIKSWLQTIANNSWSTLANTAGSYISNMWEKTVFPQFQKTMANRFPLVKGAQADATLDDFAKFFGPSGIIDTFFNTYLKPFVDIQPSGWSWKTINGLKIEFPQETLDIFTRANLIRTILFPNNSKTPKVDFTMLPESMTPHTKKFSMDLEGQKISLYRQQKQIKYLVWPGPKPGTISIEFIDRSGKEYDSVLTGPWAWYRLLNRSNMVSSGDSQHFIITFDLNGNAIRFKLSTNQIISPFLSAIISNFYCPEKLVLTNNNLKRNPGL